MASNLVFRRCLLRNTNLRLFHAFATPSLQFQKKNEVLINTNRCISISRINFANLVTIESPAYAESIKEGDIQFVKKVGESVKADDVIAKIETDKTTIDVYAPSTGVIKELLVNDGDSIKANTKIMVIDADGTTPHAIKPVEHAAPSSPTPQPTPKQQETAPLSSSPVSIPIANIPVTPFKPPSVEPPPPPQQLGGGGKLDSSKLSGSRSETRVKMSKMRQTVASRLKNAQNTCAMLTTFNEVNMGNLVELRKTYGDAFFKRHNIKLGYMSAFVKAAGVALVDQPIVNAVIENNEIVYRDYVDISVAVATPKGLVVPVIRNVEKMNYADIEKEINELGERARTNKLAIEDMQGGTFTISNGGVFGSMFGTPIINLPQSAILGMHAIFDRPVAVNGQVVIKPMMYIALTYDHRLIDGREAVTFLKRIKSGIEDPRTLLLDI